MYKFDYTITGKYNDEVTAKNELCNVIDELRIERRQNEFYSDKLIFTWKRTELEYNEQGELIKWEQTDTGTASIEVDDFWDLQIDSFEQVYVSFFNYYITAIRGDHLNFMEVTFKETEED